jgi:hypothetical protein
VQYSFKSGDEHPIPQMPHGNSKKKDHFVRTWASTKECLKDVAGKMKPREAMHHAVTSSLGGLHSCTGVGQVPRGRQQVSDIARQQQKGTSTNVGQKNMSGKGRNSDPWYLLLNDSKFQARDESTAFIRDVQVGAEPFCVVASKRQLNDIKRFCCNPIEYRPFTVDPTFNLGPYNVTPISYQNLLVTGKEGGHPTMIGPVLLHEKKTKTTYSMFAGTIKSLEPDLTNLLAFGTDDETALVEGFNQHFERATHLLCEIHLKKNIETKLTSMNITGETKQSIISDIFGRKVQDAFESGMSDAKDPEEFFVMLDSALAKWADLHPNGEEFHAWFKTNKAKEFAESVVSSVRQRAGLGCPPEKFTTNRSERTNGIIQDFIKRDCGAAKVDEYTFVTSLEKPIKIQEQEIEMAVLGKGQYTLRDQYSHIRVNGNQWDRMTEGQKKAALSRIHQIGIEDVLPTSVSIVAAHLSKDVPPVVQEMVSGGVDWISKDILTKIATSADETMKKGNIAELPGAAHDTIIVPSKSKPTSPHVVVLYSNGKVECKDCPGYSSLSICSHVLVACLKKGHLAKYLKWLTAAKRKKGGVNYSQAITFGMPAGRGRKGSKAPRKRQGKKTTTTTDIIPRPGLLTPSLITNLTRLQPTQATSATATTIALNHTNEIQVIRTHATQTVDNTPQSHQSISTFSGLAMPKSSASVAATQPLYPVPIHQAHTSQFNSTTPPSVPMQGHQHAQHMLSLPPYPTAVPGMFIIYLLHFCPPNTSVCFGCSQSLKPYGVIQQPPFDLVIVSNMEREWHHNNMLHRKFSNVYFHCCCACVQKKHHGNFHVSVPEILASLLQPEHKIYLRQTFGLDI